MLKRYDEERLKTPYNVSSLKLVGNSSEKATRRLYPTLKYLFSTLLIFIHNIFLSNCTFTYTVFSNEIVLQISKVYAFRKTDEAGVSQCQKDEFCSYLPKTQQALFKNLANPGRFFFHFRLFNTVDSEKVT